MFSRVSRLVTWIRLRGQVHKRPWDQTAICGICVRALVVLGLGQAPAPGGTSPFLEIRHLLEPNFPLLSLVEVRNEGGKWKRRHLSTIHHLSTLY